MSSSVTAADIALKSVLIAFDFSEASQKPLHHALAIARHYGAKFYLAHVGLRYRIYHRGTGSLEFSRGKNPENGATTGAGVAPKWGPGGSTP